MRPRGAGASGRTPSPMTPRHSTTTPTPLSPQTLDGLGGWHLFLAHVPLCTELEEGQEEAGSTLWWPSAGHRGVGSSLLSAGLCKINTLSSGLFHLLLLPPETHCKLRPQVTVSQGHPSLPQAAQREGAPQWVMWLQEQIRTRLPAERRQSQAFQVAQVQRFPYLSLCPQAPRHPCFGCGPVL